MAGQDQFKERLEELGAGFDAAASDLSERCSDETQELYASRGIGDVMSLDGVLEHVNAPAADPSERRVAADHVTLALHR